METKEIFRKPVRGQDNTLISAKLNVTHGVRHILELLKEMNFNEIDFIGTDAEKTHACAISCEEVAISGRFACADGLEKFRYAKMRKAERNKAVICVKGCTPEQIRMQVYQALLCGKRKLQYEGVKDIAREQGAMFHYIKDINFRVVQLGRTLMALESTAKSFAVKESDILTNESLPEQCSVNEFTDSKGNLYLLVQNTNTEATKRGVFHLNFRRPFRVYRVSPHDGRQSIVKEKVDSMNLLIMPGDADLLRFQNAEEEPYVLEYILDK